jgi:hypothetical protein
MRPHRGDVPARLFDIAALAAWLAAKRPLFAPMLFRLE